LVVARLRTFRKIAADSERNAARLDPLRCVLGADSTGWHQRRVRQWAAKGLNERGSEGFAGEKLHNIGASFHGADYLLGRSGAGHVGNLVAAAHPGNAFVTGWTDDELRARQQRMASSFGIEHSAGADENITGLMTLRQFGDCFHCAGKSKGDLHGGHPAFGAGISDAAGLIGAIGPDNHDQAGVDNFVQILQFLHGNTHYTSPVRKDAQVIMEIRMSSPDSMVSFAGILILGFFLGMRHATDPDHVIAVMTIVTRQRGVAKAGVIGALWGMGHTLTIFLVGAAIILFKVVIPPRLGLSMEFAVGLMLVLLGVLNLTGVLGWLQHRHGASSLPADKPNPTGDSWLDRNFRGLGFYNMLRPLVVGTVHGLAGSAAVAILVMTTIADPRWAVAYLLLFGLGTIAGMAAMTTVLAYPIVYAGRQMFRWNQAITVGSGLLSVAFGLFISFQIGVGGGLFAATPHWIPR